jgi:pimeloyl-ACP methyl ester carboxylesterase
MGDERRIELGDGRSLAYREYGDPGGDVVVNCHGGLLCGLDVAPFDEVARALGLRIVSPDRPGLGRSSAAPGRVTADWSDDVRQLLDTLEVERCAVLGWSMGAQYALACAALLPTRVSRTTVIAGCPPLDRPETFAQLNPMDRRFTRLAQHHPHVARTTFRALGAMAGHAPEAWAHATTRGAVPDEASTVEGLPDPGIAAAAAHALAHGDGMVEEYLAWVRPWGFAPEDVTGAVEIWQGDEDELVPPAWGTELAGRLPRGQLHWVEGAGHFLGYTRTNDVLASLRVDDRTQT